VKCSGEQDVLSAFDHEPTSLGEFLSDDSSLFRFGMTLDGILSDLGLTSAEREMLFTEPVNFIMSRPSESLCPDSPISEGEDEVEEPSEDDCDSDFTPMKKTTSGMDTRKGKGKKKRCGVGEDALEDDFHASAGSELRLDESVLRRIFDPERLKSEKKELEDGHVFLECNFPLRKKSETDMVKQLTSLIYSNNLIAECRLLSPSDGLSDGMFSTELASMVMDQLVDSVEIIPSIIVQMERQLILARALQRQMCQSLLVVYQWHVYYGPQLADHLILIYRHRGEDTLAQLCPTFGQLMCHIIRHAKEVQGLIADRTVKGARRRRPTKVRDGESGNTATIPDNLFGILPMTKGKSVSLSNIQPPFGNKEERVYAKARDCFLDTIWKLVILPNMRILDTSINQKNKAKTPSTSSKGLRSRLISRGAVIHCIVEAWGGDDICTSLNLHEIITSPMKIFHHFAATDFNKFSAFISGHPDTALVPLKLWLENLISKSAIVQESTSGTALQVHRGLLEMEHKRPIPLEEFLDPNKPLFVESALRCPLKRSRRMPRKLNFQFKISDILSDSAGPQLIIPNLILREALNQRRGIAAGHGQLRWVLEGCNFNTGNQQFDPDQSDPIRADSRYAQNIRCRIPPAQLTKKNGLSNLLTFMGTGQSGPTMDFQDAGSMVFSSLGEAINRFDSALTTNDVSSVKRKVSNGQIWGQKCSSLDLFSRKFYWGYTGLARTQAIRDKLAPYWTNSVSEEWAKFLVDLLDNADPLKFNGQRRTWRQALHFIQDLGVSPFRTGLTAFQMANNLALLGLCERPTPYEIVEWINENRGLGAFRGLLKLGFTLSTLETIYVAFMIVHDHMNEFLSKDDRDILRFDAMLVEQVLCKVVRWEDRVGEEAMQKICEEVKNKSGEWVMGANANNSLCFPFPHKAVTGRGEETLDNIAQELDVCVPNPFEFVH
jgi:hypothetical protein